MKKIVVAALLAAAVNAQAQDTSATCHEAPPEARALLSALHFREQFATGMAISLPNAIRTEAGKAIGRNRTISDEKRKEIAARIAQKQPRVADGIKAITDNTALMDCVMDQVGKSFLHHFSTAEMQEITTFYASPTGRKVVEKMMLASGEAMASTQRLLAPKVTELAQALERELLAP
ncbi:MAG: DUF2059 domain-containing protein [Pseudomonadota bacterium]|nr:DUF2059 domain-containing protein [Pseudomonadota bacterium]